MYGMSWLSHKAELGPAAPSRRYKGRPEIALHHDRNLESILTTANPSYPSSATSLPQRTTEHQRALEKYLAMIRSGTRKIVVMHAAYPKRPQNLKMNASVSAVFLAPTP